MKKLFIISLCTIALSSCTVYQYTSRNAGIDRHNFEATSTIVDVKPDFSKRVSATSNWHRTAAQAMEECKYLAITANNIDIVVDPIYQIQVRPHKINKRYKAVMTGIAGYYNNPRTPIEDMNHIKNFTREEIENFLLLHQAELVLPYFYQPELPKGDIINVHSDHSKCGHKCAPKCEKKEYVAPAPEKPAPAPAPAPEQTGFRKNNKKK